MLSKYIDLDELDRLYEGMVNICRWMVNMGSHVLVDLLSLTNKVY
jgi:hypothetical protein